MLDIVRQQKIETVFLDGSNLGELARAVKRTSPDTRVVAFFHNVEARFFWGALRKSRSAKASAVLAANYVAERKAVRYSDVLIALSARDSVLLGRLYGRNATHISPIAVADRFSARPTEVGRVQEAYLLFVGGAFYANQEGISWYARHVAPRIALKTVVVGHGMEAMKAELEKTGNMEVVGPVESLAPWYRDALAVVAPIFDGSGMKTKVAEALMHGKRVIGTAEAFSGYENLDDRAGVLCRTAGDFKSAAAMVHRDHPLPFDTELRRVYLQTYGADALKRRLAAALGVVVPSARTPD